MEDIPFYLERILEEDIPELLDYLRPGISVLDVGCGPGNLTLEVGRVISPGKVIGLDKQESSIQHATDLASSQKAENVSFLLGDAHAFDFDENSFDVVYSNTAIHSFIDPVESLKAQRRVTKPGGWVIAAGVRDWGLVNRYPPCPNWEKVWDAWAKHDELLIARHKTGEEIQLNIRAYAARMCPAWFTKAGFADLQVRIRPYLIQYHGAEEMEADPHDLLPIGGVDEFGFKESVSARVEAIVADGLLDADTLAKAKEERDRWYQDERAFGVYLFVFVAGRA
jgi:ubiquinone/menaquinone biosynthesis C-methylase UbiE